MKRWTWKVIAATAVVGLSALALQASASAAGGVSPTPHAVPATLPFLPQTETVFHPLNPVRILDTRSSLGGHLGKISSTAAFNLQVTGGAVPAGASAVEFNLTVVKPTTASFLTVWPAGSAQPNVSNINYSVNQTVANSNTVRLSSNGKMTIKPGTGSTHVLVDIAGYYSTSTAWGQQGYVGWVWGSDGSIGDSHSNNGAGITLANSSTGVNVVTFDQANIGAFLVASGNIQVSTIGTNPEVCTTLAGSSGANLNVTVTCKDPSDGSPVNALFYLQVTG